jgi:hypothetical protein
MSTFHRLLDLNYAKHFDDSNHSSVVITNGKVCFYVSFWFSTV